MEELEKMKKFLAEINKKGLSLVKIEILDNLQSMDFVENDEIMFELINMIYDFYMNQDWISENNLYNICDIVRCNYTQIKELDFKWDYEKFEKIILKYM